MKIGVLGAGAIGCAVGGRMALGGADVVLVGRGPIGERVAAGLRLSRWGEAPVAVPPERAAFTTDPGRLEGCDAVLVATKSSGTADAGRTLREVLRPGVPVGSLQNGVQNAGILSNALPGHPIWPGMVPFNIVWTDDGRLHQGTSGPVVLPTDAAPLVALIRAGGGDAVTHPDVPAVQWGKLLLNLNNAVNALSGLPLRQMLSDRGYRTILADVIDEGLAALASATIRVRGVGKIRPGLAPYALRLPDWLFFRAASAMIRIDPEARSSMADDLARGRPTEVDELNGEIVKIAGPRAPLNAGLVRLIHEREGKPVVPMPPVALREGLTGAAVGTPG